MVGMPAERETPACAGSHIADHRPNLVKSILEELFTADRHTDATVVLPASLALAGMGEGSAQAQCFAQLSAALLQSRWLEALAASQRILRNAKQPVSGALQAKIAELRASIEQQLLVTPVIDFVRDSSRIHLLPRRSVLIGRPGGQLPADIAVDCRWLSRGERNLSLFSDGANWFLEDLGSTNGNFLNGERLLPGRPVGIAVGQTQIQIGRMDESAAPVTLELRRPVRDPGAVVISLRHSGSALATASTWPTVQQDLARRWIVFRSEIGIAAEEDCAVRIEGGGPGIAAAIRYENGFWAVPPPGSKVRVNDTTFEAPVPVPTGASLRVGNTRFSVEAPASGRAEISVMADSGEEL